MFLNCVSSKMATKFKFQTRLTYKIVNTFAIAYVNKGVQQQMITATFSGVTQQYSEYSVRNTIFRINLNSLFESM